jgi:hypothetical protein
MAVGPSTGDVYNLETDYCYKGYGENDYCWYHTDSMPYGSAGHSFEELMGASFECATTTTVLLSV